MVILATGSLPDPDGRQRWLPGADRLPGLEAGGVWSPEEVLRAIDKANEIDDRPVVIDFRTVSREKVYPLVRAGKTNDQIVVPPFQDGPHRDVVQ